MFGVSAPPFENSVGRASILREMLDPKPQVKHALMFNYPELYLYCTEDNSKGRGTIVRWCVTCPACLRKMAHNPEDYERRC